MPRYEAHPTGVRLFRAPSFKIGRKLVLKGIDKPGDVCYNVSVSERTHRLKGDTKMAKGTWTIATEVVRETEKAICVRGDGVNVWLPKSCCAVYRRKEDGMIGIWMKMWLWMQKRHSFNYQEYSCMTEDDAAFVREWDLVWDSEFPNA